MTDFRLVLCENCGSEGRLYRRCMVYEPGCAFAHEDQEDAGECPECKGTGRALVEVEPITIEDLEDNNAPFVC